MTRLAPLNTWRSAICESDLGPTTRHVALTISLYANERGGSCFPGAPRLARDTGLSERAIRTHLATLTAAGWLALDHRGGQRGERRQANAYRLVTPPDTRSEPSGSDTPDDPAPLHDVHPCTTFTREPDDTDPCTSRPQPLHDVHPNYPRTTHRTPPGDADFVDGAAITVNSPVVELVAGYVADYRATHSEANPSTRWKSQAGRAARSLLADGADPDDLALCLGVIARKSKAPNTLGHVLADLQASRSFQ